MLGREGECEFSLEEGAEAQRSSPKLVGEVEGLSLDKSGGEFSEAALRNLDQMDLENRTEILKNNSCYWDLDLGSLSSLGKEFR